MTATSHGFSRNSQILVYIMPVGSMSPRMYMEGVKMLQASSEIPMSSLTRPGGYSAELSPFRTLSWDSATSILYRFEDTMSAASSASTAVPCEDVHAWNRPLAVIGLCHCPSTANLRDAYADFKRAAANYPSAIVQKVYALEHAFGAGTLEDVSALDDLVMFPLAAPLSDGHTTVSLHLQVVLDAMTVTILMSLESTVRGVLRQHQQQSGAAVSSTDLSESGFGLLSTQVDPPSLVGASSPHPPFLASASNRSSTPALRTGSGSSTLLPRPSGVSNAASAMDLSGGTSLSGTSSRKAVRSSTRSRQEKLVADYALLVGCVSDAMEYYSTAIDGLRDEVKRASSTTARTPVGGDGLWLAAALEGYITALYLTMRRQKGGNGVKFNVELVEKASEAATWYAKVGCVDLEANLVLSMGWYYAELVDDPLARRRRSDPAQRADEAEWVRRLCIESHQRLLSIPRTMDSASAAVPPHRMIKHVLELARQGRRVGYTRKELLYVLDASALLCQRGSRPPSAPRPAASSLDLHAAYVLLEQVLHGLSSAPADHSRQPKERAVGWRRLRFYVLRQLVVLARKLRRPDAIATYALELLHLLAQSPIVTETAEGVGGSAGWNDHIFTTIHQPHADESGLKSRGQLHLAPTVYATPPPSMEKDVKKAAAMLLQHHASTTSLLSSSYFKNLPLLAASNGATPAGAGGSTTPRTLLSTPRQLMSAVMTTSSSTPVVNSTSSFFDAADESSSVVLADPPARSPSPSRPSSSDNKATGAASTLRRHDIVNLHARNHIQQWQHACWRLLHDDSAAAVPLSVSTSTVELPLTQDNGLVRFLRFGVSTPDTAAPATSLRRLDHVTQVVQRSKNNGQTTSLPANSTFFYNPFQAKDAKTAATNAPQTTFPLYATIALDLVVDNPLEIDVHVPHVTAWIEDAAHDGKSSKAQCVPVALKLLPRDRHVVLQLTVRPTQVGRLVVLGCLLRLKHQTLRYALERPLVLEIIPPLPTLVLAPSPASSMFERQTKHVSVDVTNPTGLSVSHMFLDLTVVVVKRAAAKSSSTGCIPLVNSLQLDDTPPSLPQQLTVGGVDVTTAVSPSLNHLERLAGRSSGTIELFVTCLHPCTIELQLRALYCHTATDKQLYRETVATLAVTCEPAVRISSVVPLAATPLKDGRVGMTYAADLWNPSPSTPFVVQVPDDEAIDVPPLCVRRVLLPAASLEVPFPWTTSSSSGSMAAIAGASSQLVSAGNALPWRLHVALDGHPCALMLASIQLHSFVRLVVTMTPSPNDETPPAALTDVEVQLFEQGPTVAGALEATDKLVVAGQLMFDPPPSATEHAVHVMAMAHGVFHVRCVGKWKRPNDTWGEVESPTLIIQTV